MKRFIYTLLMAVLLFAMPAHAMVCLDNTDTLEGGASVAAVVDYTVHGLVGSTFGNIAQGQLSDTNPSVLYTAASAVSVVSIIYVNTHSAAVTVDLYLDPANAGTPRRMIPEAMTLQAGYSMVFDGQRCTVVDTNGGVVSGTNVSDTAYGAGWDAITNIAPSKNAVYDALSGGTISPTFAGLIVPSITPAANFELNQNSVQPFTSVAASAVDNTLYLKEGNVVIGTATPGAKLHTYVDNSTETGVNGLVLEQDGTGDIGLSFLLTATRRWYMGIDNSDSDKFKIQTQDYDFATAVFTIDTSGNVGIGTTAPAVPLAINRAADGTLLDFEVGDAVQGYIASSGGTVTLTGFTGSHNTQLKTGQLDMPVGSVVISTGEIVPCSIEKDKYTKVSPLTAVNIVTKLEAGEIVNVQVEDKDNILSETITYAYDPETDTEKATTTYTYGTKTIQKKQLKPGYYFHPTTRTFYTLKPNYVKRDNDFYLKEIITVPQPSKEHYPYVATTTVAGDKRFYGVWMGKVRDNAKGMSFGKDSDPVYLVAQVGLYQCRVTDTNGNILNGDYLETSTRAMEAQKQTSLAKLSSTVAKSLVDVDFATVSVDPVLGYKWKLIPCTF